MSGRRKFIPGETYRLEEFAGQVWGNMGRAQRLPPETLFVYHDDEPGELGYFEELVENENPLVDAGPVGDHVQALRESGMSVRAIATKAGVGIESVHRATAGHGRRIRESTATALLSVSRNGQP